MCSACPFLKASPSLAVGVLCCALTSAQPVWHVHPRGAAQTNPAASQPQHGGAGNTMNATSLQHALEASRAKQGEPRRIVLAEGRHFLSEPLVFDGRDSSLVIEGAGMGKTTIYGGEQVTGWQPDGDRFWTAPVPEVAEGTWDFRALVVNDRLCERARLPETGTFTHESTFPVRWMSTAGGGWERKPTEEERTTLRYREGDLGEWLSVANAEVTVYHMWDESMVGVEAHDPETRTLTFSSPAGHPPGAFNRNTYVVWNVREGMKRPGQWYLDREGGRIVYWPLEGEDMAGALVVAPRVETILDIRGSGDKPVRDLSIRSLTLSTTTTPCKAGGFGANQYRGAIHASGTAGLVVDRVEITNTAGHAIREWGGTDIQISNCALHHVGAGGIRMGGGTGHIENNSIHHVGRLYPSAIALAAGGGTYTIRRNDIHHTPYSGMAIGGQQTVVEENLLYRCMQELHDGAAIYVSGAEGNIIRRNVARDIVQTGTGYGVSAYYLDEKCRNCIVEKNVSIGVARPSHNHMTLDCVLRDNVFIAEGDVTLSFNRCAGHSVTGNTIQLDGELSVTDPDAITEWEGNLLVQTGDRQPAISDSFPKPERIPRRKPLYSNAMPMPAPPEIDGVLEGGEWPSGGLGLGELPDQRRARGAPVLVKLCADDTALFIGASVVSMFPAERKLGHTWGVDEGIEIAIQEQPAGAAPVTLVLRGYADGTVQALHASGASLEETDMPTPPVDYAAQAGPRTWTCEWRIPFKTIGFIPAPEAWWPMNVTVYRSEDRQNIQWAGSLAETWDLTYGGRLRCKSGPDTAQSKPPVAAAARVKAPVRIDGKAAEGEWPGTALTLAQSPAGPPIAGAPGSAQVARDEDTLYVHMHIPTAGPNAVTAGHAWRRDDGAEVCIRGTTPDGRTVVWVVRGYAGGAAECSTEAGAPEAAVRRLQDRVRFASNVSGTDWQGEWALPFAALGIDPQKGAAIPFNLGVYRSATDEWINWVGTRGPTWKLDNAGVLNLSAADADK